MKHCPMTEDGIGTRALLRRHLHSHRLSDVTSPSHRAGAHSIRSGPIGKSRNNCYPPFSYPPTHSPFDAASTHGTHMLTNLYYFLKPMLPKNFRIRVRQWHAQALLSRHATTWPIDEAAGTTPAHWPGWPAGKQFAFVLTHDVESTRGIQRIPQLLELDRQFNLRSSFNLVPDGTYDIPPDLLSNITRNHFEVGVHGLKHDGKLYRSKRAFPAKAAEIRDYMRKWNSVGFRSPLMQHKLGWLNTLGCEYDSSTFDTDPFEPQPDGVGTVFPFWVPSSTTGGYVELPYTLVQDFTLFSILKKRDISYWTDKLDWLVERGGMALLNVHPDYMCFQGAAAQDEYPVSYYSDFLYYLTERYKGCYWNALPRDVSRYYCNAVPEHLRNTRRKICMLAYTNYTCDNRVRRYAETLARRGDAVDSVALAGNASDAPRSTLNGVTVYQIPKHAFQERSEWTYVIPHFLFLWRASRMLARLHNQNRYDLIHVHNIPDFLVFAAWYPKLFGAQIILDIHDVVPELFANKFSSSFKNFYVDVLKVIEKSSVGFADHVIISNHLWRDKLVARSVSPRHCSVFVNHVDPTLFIRKPRTRHDGRYIVIFPGTFQHHQGLDIGIDAFAQFHKSIPNAEFHLYGGGNDTVESSLRKQVAALGLEHCVKFFGVIPLDGMPEVIANADLGVVPKRADSFGNEAYSTKIMEFLSQGVPVVASRTKIDTYYFDEGTVHFFDSGDPSSMAEAMLDVASDDTLRTSLISNGIDYVSRHGWQKKQRDYLALIDTLATESFHNSQKQSDRQSLRLA